MVRFYSDSNSKDHPRAYAGQKAIESQSQVTLLKTEIKHLDRPARNRSSSPSPRSSSTNSTLRGPARYDPSEQSFDLDELSLLPQAHHTPHGVQENSEEKETMTPDLIPSYLHQSRLAVNYFLVISVKAIWAIGRRRQGKHGDQRYKHKIIANNRQENIEFKNLQPYIYTILNCSNPKEDVTGLLRSIH